MAASGWAEHGQVERFLAVDDQGILLRVTWRTSHGFLNVSLWRGGTCVETFHLSPKDAGDLVAFMATTLIAALPDPSSLRLRLVDETPRSQGRQAAALRERVRTARARLSHVVRGFGKRS